MYVGGCSLPAELPESVKGKAVDLARSLVNPNIAKTVWKKIDNISVSYLI